MPHLMPVDDVEHETEADAEEAAANLAAEHPDREFVVVLVNVHDPDDPDAPNFWSVCEVTP